MGELTDCYLYLGNGAVPIWVESLTLVKAACILRNGRFTPVAGGALGHLSEV